MISNNETNQLMRDATAVIEKQHRTIAGLTTRVAQLEALLDRSPHVANAVARDPALLQKTVDLLLAEPAPQASAAPTKPSGGGRFFTRHGGNVLPALSG